MSVTPSFHTVYAPVPWLARRYSTGAPVPARHLQANTSVTLAHHHMYCTCSEWLSYVNNACQYFAFIYSNVFYNLYPLWYRRLHYLWDTFLWHCRLSVAPTWSNLALDRRLTSQTLLHAEATLCAHDLVHARLEPDVGVSLATHTTLGPVRLQQLSENDRSHTQSYIICDPSRPNEWQVGHFFYKVEMVCKVPKSWCQYKNVQRYELVYMVGIQL